MRKLEGKCSPFQITDVCVRDSRASHTRGTGARNERHLCALNYNVRAGVEVVHGLLDNIMVALRIPYNEEERGDGYWLEGKDRKLAKSIDNIYTTYFS